MNVLIINGFSDNQKGREKYGEFESTIKSTFTKCRKSSGIDDIRFILRDYSNIDDFLFNNNSNSIYSNDDPTAKRNFEKLDFVFFDGSEKFLPWKKLGAKFYNLLRMCKMNNKPLYTGGVGMQVLIYLLATNYCTDYNVINSKGEVKSLEEIQSIPQSFLKTLKKNDCFLDFVSGDLFQYKRTADEWAAFVNIGLHNHLLAEKYNSRGKYVRNTETYRPKSVNGYLEDQVTSLNTEMKGYLQKQYLSHWMLKDLPKELILPTSLTWYSHNFSLREPSLSVRTLIDSRKGPLLIENGNSVGAAFHLSKKYPHSKRLLENFIKRKFQEVQDSGFANAVFKEKPQIVIDQENFIKKTKYEITNSKVTEAENETKDMSEHAATFSTMIGKGDAVKKLERPTSSFLVQTHRPFSKIKQVKQLGNHVGFGFSRRNMIYVDNNAVNIRPISSTKNNCVKSPSQTQKDFTIHSNRLCSPRETKLFEANKQSTASALSAKKDNRINMLLETNSSSCKKNNKQPSSIADLRDQADQNDFCDKEYLNFVDKDKMDENLMIEYFKKKRMELTGHLEDLSQKQNFNINKLTDLKIYNKKNPEKRINVKSEKSHRQEHFKNENDFRSYRHKQKEEVANFFAMLLPYVRQEEFPKPIERHIIGSGFTYEKEGKEVVRVDLREKMPNNYKQKFQKYDKDLNNFASKPLMSCSSAYITEEERRRKEFHESKQKWVSNKDFRRVFGKNSTNLKPVSSVVSKGSPNSPISHKFREADRSKWIINKNFRL